MNNFSRIEAKLGRAHWGYWYRYCWSHCWCVLHWVCRESCILHVISGCSVWLRWEVEPDSRTPHSFTLFIFLPALQPGGRCRVVTNTHTHTHTRTHTHTHKPYTTTLYPCGPGPNTLEFSLISTVELFTFIYCGVIFTQYQCQLFIELITNITSYHP